MTDHPITPPPELVQQWAAESLATQHLCTQAARWGSDQELEACVKYFHEYDSSWGENSELITDFRAARRPKTPSLKERALDELDLIPTHDNEGRTVGVDVSIIRRALEQLND